MYIHTHVCINTYTHIYVYIYIHTYISLTNDWHKDRRQSQREAGGGKLKRGDTEPKVKCQNGREEETGETGVMLDLLQQRRSIHTAALQSSPSWIQFVCLDKMVPTKPHSSRVF